MTTPLVLGFDTSGPWCRAALMRGSDVLAQADTPMQKGQGETLVPMLETLLTGAGARWDSLDAIGVGIGPGNFTGIRISVSAARGLALALNIPAIGVSRFDALALDNPSLPVAVPALRGQLWVRMPGGTPQLAEHPPPDALGEGLNAPAYPLAVAIARLTAARMDQPQPRPAPLYLRAPDAAPPSGSAPVLIE